VEFLRRIRYGRGGAAALEMARAGLKPAVALFLARRGYSTPGAVRDASDAELLSLYGFGESRLRAVREWAAAHPPPTPGPLPDWLAEE
jgi:hypothetical protein